MLIFDQEHFEITKVYMVYTPDKQEHYVFDNAVETKQFIDKYYENKTCARFAYYIENYQAQPDERTLQNDI